MMVLREPKLLLWILVQPLILEAMESTKLRDEDLFILDLLEDIYGRYLVGRAYGNIKMHATLREIAVPRITNYLTLLF